MITQAHDSIRLGIVEDQPLFLSMLEFTLANVEGITVVAAVGTAREAEQRITPGAVDVALLDIDLPDGNGIALGVILRRQQPGLGILLLSAQDSMDLLLDLPPDVRNGWSYLSKTSSTSTATLVAAVRASAAGKTTLDSALIDRKKPRAPGPPSHGSRTGSTRCCGSSRRAARTRVSARPSGSPRSLCRTTSTRSTARSRSTPTRPATRA